MNASSIEDHGLPRPFYETAWPRRLRAAAAALWQWHLHLARPLLDAEGREDPAAFFAREAERAEAGAPLGVIPEEAVRAAYDACRAHGVPLDLLARQVAAARHFAGPMRFETYDVLDAFVQQWAMALARSLGRLAGLGGSWQIRQIDELARAFFLTGRLMNLPGDLAQDRLYLPLEELAQAGVTVEQLRRGAVNERVRRLLWKQTIRARDAFAQGQGLAKDLSGRMRWSFKQWWHGGLGVLNEIERRDFDVWTEPVGLSGPQRFRVRLQASVGRTSFR